MRPFRLVTFNIAHGRGLAPVQGLTTRRRMKARLLRIARLLKRLEADAVALQEIDRDSSWSGRIDQVEFLRRAGGFAFAEFGANARREGRLRLDYGNAVLSRHPLLFSESVGFGARRVGGKGFLFAEIDFHGRRLPVANLHLHYGRRARRFMQLDLFLEYLEARRRAAGADWAAQPLVCGDLNNGDTRGDATAALLAHLSEAGNGSYTLLPARGRTFPSPLPARRLDFVFLPPGVTGAKGAVVRSLLSDHRPVVVDFNLPAGGCGRGQTS
ncbi:MAG: endonuclease/exonuclease/phosphatase family protein [Opitutaceae bacterium]|jgi:endonuclease/exonuclease/phosphatase family metal-dependent hydrolase|nr:endonuclease/exonuclease/phosphatase family protein [Opitutaceae bacterium]